MTQRCGRLRHALAAGLVAWLGFMMPAAAAEPATSCPPTAAMPTPEQIQAGMKAARDRGFLWRLRKDGRESWLYGTVHVARIEWIYPGPLVTAALKASDTIALELDMLDPDIGERLRRSIAAEPAAQALPDSLQQRVNRRAALECIPAEALAALSPPMQIATLESLVARRDGLDPSYGIDMALAGWGRGARKAVVSLETPELQMATLTLPTPDETLEFIDAALTELESGRAAPSLLRVAQVWADGDLDLLSRYESWCECIKTPADRTALARLLDDRNPGLADGIAALHAKGQRVFAAVGSLHMIGPMGLPALMAQRGFQVEPVPLARR